MWVEQHELIMGSELLGTVLPSTVNGHSQNSSVGGGIGPLRVLFATTSSSACSVFNWAWTVWPLQKREVGWQVSFWWLNLFLLLVKLAGILFFLFNWLGSLENCRGFLCTSFCVRRFVFLLNTRKYHSTLLPLRGGQFIVLTPFRIPGAFPAAGQWSLHEDGSSRRYSSSSA